MTESDWLPQGSGRSLDDRIEAARRELADATAAHNQSPTDREAESRWRRADRNLQQLLDKQSRGEA